MSQRLFEIAWSACADCSAHDRHVYIRTTDARSKADTVIVGVRYKSTEPSSLHEIELDSDDLRSLARWLEHVAEQLEEGGE